MRPLALWARVVQARRIRRCARYGGTTVDGRKTGVCHYPEDHYPYWKLTWRLS